MSAYYNENDPKAAAWLRELIRQGHIAPGDVDERSIEDLIPNELKQYTQCHFFAGIGVWSYALRLAGWPDDRSVWTGSCPCQPFSAAGKSAGTSDERHLWPTWQHLIRECKPAIIFGEQVASKAADTWADLVQDDVEALGYAFGAVPFPAASVGAPHIRDRLYWCAVQGVDHAAGSRRNSAWRWAEGQARNEARLRGPERRCATSELGDTDGKREVPVAGVRQGAQPEPDRTVAEGGLGHHHHPGLEGRGLPAGECRGERTPWTASDFVWCRDSKWRPVEPGTFPLAHGAPARVGRLRGYGNAIVAQQAQVFIEASALV